MTSFADNISNRTVLLVDIYILSEDSAEMFSEMKSSH